MQRKIHYGLTYNVGFQQVISAQGRVFRASTLAGLFCKKNYFRNPIVDSRQSILQLTYAKSFTENTKFQPYFHEPPMSRFLSLLCVSFLITNRSVSRCQRTLLDQRASFGPSIQVKCKIRKLKERRQLWQIQFRCSIFELNAAKK